LELVAYGTLVAAIIAALAAIWSSVISQRQLNLTKSASSPPLPVVNARLSPVGNQPAWSSIGVSITNRADIPLNVRAVEFARPRHLLLLTDKNAYDDPDQYNPTFLDPLPLDRAKAEVELGNWVGAVGSTRFGSARNAVHFTFYAHDPAGLLPKEERTQFAIKLQWEDHDATMFPMTVTVMRT
jgi:hypothetical protein